MAHTGVTTPPQLRLYEYFTEHTVHDGAPNAPIEGQAARCKLPTRTPTRGPAPLAHASPRLLAAAHLPRPPCSVLRLLRVHNTRLTAPHASRPSFLGSFVLASYFLEGGGVGSVFGKKAARSWGISTIYMVWCTRRSGRSS